MRDCKKKKKKALNQRAKGNVLCIKAMMQAIKMNTLSEKKTMALHSLSLRWLRATEREMRTEKEENEEEGYIYAERERECVVGVRVRECNVMHLKLKLGLGPKIEIEGIISTTRKEG